MDFNTKRSRRITRTLVRRHCVRPASSSTRPGRHMCSTSRRPSRDHRRRIARGSRSLRSHRDGVPKPAGWGSPGAFTWWRPVAGSVDPYLCPGSRQRRLLRSRHLNTMYSTKCAKKTGLIQDKNSLRSWSSWQELLFKKFLSKISRMTTRFELLKRLADGSFSFRHRSGTLARGHLAARPSVRISGTLTNAGLDIHRVTGRGYQLAQPVQPA